MEKGTFKGYVRTTFRVTEMDRMKVPHMGGCESWTIKKAEHNIELMLLNCGVGRDS